MQIKWTISALKDLDLEMEYLAKKEGTQTAEDAYLWIKNKIKVLKDFSSIGREGRIFGTRELIIEGYPYIVPYRIKNDKIEILALFHARRKLPENW